MLCLRLLSYPLISTGPYCFSLGDVPTCTLECLRPPYGLRRTQADADGGISDRDMLSLSTRGSRVKLKRLWDTFC